MPESSPTPEQIEAALAYAASVKTIGPPRGAILHVKVLAEAVRAYRQKEEVAEASARPPRPKRWAAQQRQDFIATILAATGQFNRQDLVDMYGISATQASMDLRDFRAEHPHMIRYNPSTKRYERP